ncbi:hypothetical protein [Effusibacillus pohliae]|uniref:hypothetical protein n=1 Tax=Effusibacillus pohliae TaxID=232270 RepID=UPI000377922D|nr:hypothetical protein [Effusibacillus pohliae]
MNELWRLNANELAAYTEDHELMRRIRRSYPDFRILAEYYRSGRLFAVVYVIPNEKKRAARRLFANGTKSAKIAV